jgi:signal transduction histidine kinase
MPHGGEHTIGRQHSGRLRCGGTGLELYIVQELARRLGGQLSLRIREGGGLRACLRLPSA